MKPRTKNGGNILLSKHISVKPLTVYETVLNLPSPQIL